MKKVISLLLTSALAVALCIPALALASDEPYFGAYERVVIMGIDGAGKFFDEAETPCFDRIFAGGSKTFSGKAEFITISAQNWGAMLLGVSAVNHGLTNTIVGNVERDSESKYASIFSLTREAYPNATLASFSDWSPINYGIIENDINVYKASADDDVLVGDICNYLETNDPKLMFVQFDSVDGAGHSNGYGSQEYMSRLNVVDGYIGQVYDCLDALDRLDETLFIVVSDHGGTMLTKSHGGLTRNESLITFAVSGKGIVTGEMGKAKNRDIAAVSLYALGIEQPDYMTSNVPDNVFEGHDYTARPLGDGIIAWIVAHHRIIMATIADLFA